MTEDENIPVLREVVLDGEADELPPNGGIEDLAPIVERIAARIDRALEGKLEAMVQEAVAEALHASLATYQEQVRVLILRELMEQLPRIAGSRRGDPGL